ncbi:hypothetical protein LV89_02399 [Arcicella aurantiaca]|uniref:Uncharacterized protein n=1 Tax=Arcicella aurantiaca TaxID=591202 RepID=A0A316E854_9BACT|nr:hypothetical protein [Arcicella aurantiaca]PWK26551.1 hypothetical protein LV89_02399 [Arcicella aurantiaca]
MKKILYICFLFIAFITVSCKVDDPFVDRVVAPVLVIFEDAAGKTSGLTTEPSISSSASVDASITVRLLELNKDGLLDYKVGIDSIPAKAIPVTFKLRSGAKISDVTTDDKGRSTLKIAWKSLGITAPVAGSSVALSCSGTYKDISFTKYFRLTATK